MDVHIHNVARNGDILDICGDPFLLLGDIN